MRWVIAETVGPATRVALLEQLARDAMETGSAFWLLGTADIDPC